MKKSYEKLDDSNYYENCESCGDCCHLTVLCMSDVEVERIREYLVAYEITAHDNGPHQCPFLQENQKCAVYPVRSQTCRLYSCQMTRKELLKKHPEIAIDDEKPLVNLRELFC